jgi:uncharacterized membrane protein
MSELIIIGYPDETTAENVWAELVKLQHDYLVDLEDAAIIRRDQKGKLHVTTPVHHQAAWGGLSGLFWGKATPDKFLEALRPYGGTVLKTSLPRDAEQELMKALHGDNPDAPTWEHAGSTAATGSSA